MGLMDILKQYAQPTAEAASTGQTHFDEVAGSVSPNVIGKGPARHGRAREKPRERRLYRRRTDLPWRPRTAPPPASC